MKTPLWQTQVSTTNTKIYWLRNSFLTVNLFLTSALDVFFLFSLREAVSIVCAHPKGFILYPAHLVFVKVYLLQHLKSNGYILSEQRLTTTLVARFGRELFIKESIIFSCGLSLRSIESYSVLMVSHPLNYGFSVSLIN